MPAEAATPAARVPGAPAVRRESLRIAGTRVDTGRTFEVHDPYSGALVGTVPLASVAEVRRALEAARAFRPQLTRYERFRICQRTAEALRARREEFAQLITAESGLCLKDSLYEVGRACDVFTFAGNAALQDDGQVFSCDLTEH
ncbi:MAG TPA: aldehyde dehydrogenase family protein, partial [Steroidobacteraceae bacterium]|nr:aldehyde dehydrogenase family protein [Steroidobacteraceae bacterium]